MLIRWFLFETKLGELLLILLERSTDWLLSRLTGLARSCCGEPKSARQSSK